MKKRRTIAAEGTARTPNMTAGGFSLSVVFHFLCVLCGPWVSLPAWAADPVKDYPLRPVRLVSPFAAGGTSDIVGRLLAPRLAERFGQNFIVENRPGAGGILGSAYVAKSTPDGHTLLLASGAFTSVAATVKSLPYDPVRDFAWVSMVVTYPFVIVVHPGSPIRTVEDLIHAAKRAPGKLVYGSVGVGSVFHLATELFSSMTGTELLHVPYKGGSEPLTELMGGRIQVIFTTLAGAYPHIEANRVRAVAVASLERSPQLPNVPTVAERLPGYEVTSFQGIAAARGTPPAVVARLNRELRAILESPEIRKRLVDQGGELRSGSPEDTSRHVVGEIAKWKRIVEARKIEIN